MPQLSAEPVLRMAAHARKLRGKPIVIKLGGSAMEDPAATAGVLEACLALQTIGIRLIIVHGGGKPIDRAMTEAGLSPKKVNGIRYTDDATLEIVVKVLLEINAQLRTNFADLGGAVGGFLGVPEVWPIHGERLLLPGLDLQPIDLGRVGQITNVDEAILDHLSLGAIPILPSLAVASDGGWLNVNADSVASAVGGKVQAESVFFLTDTPGVLQDRANPESIVSHLTVSEAKEWIDSGVIAGGMIPKVEACFEAIAAGANRAVILDGRNPYTLIAQFSSDKTFGTAIVP